MATTEYANTVQEQILDSVAKSQDAVLEAVRNWSKSTEGIAPKLPVVELPGETPEPAEVLKNAFDFAEKLLASQRKFSEELVSAITPKPAAKSSKSK